jgi:hypothetical protein
VSEESATRRRVDGEDATAELVCFVLVWFGISAGMARGILLVELCLLENVDYVICKYR